LSSASRSDPGGQRDQVNVIEEHDHRPPLVSLMLDQASQCCAQLTLAIARRTTDAGVGDSDIETKLQVETPWPAGREFGMDRRDETGEELVCRLRVRHRQHDGVASLLPQPAPVHQQRCLADRPLAGPKHQRPAGR